MIRLRMIAVVTLSSFLLGGGGATGCVAKQKPAPVAEVPARENPSSDLKVLAEGFHSSITTPFVAVVRDPETYAALVKLDNDLPKLDEGFFKSNIVVAAFLGERNTGGYGVEIRREVSGSFNMREPKSYIRIIERAPGKGVMVPEMITSPFKVVSFEVNGTPDVMLAPDNSWQQKMRPYRVTSGTFTTSGGFAGIRDQFEIAGKLQIMRESNLATFVFLVLSPGQGYKRSLADFTTGIVSADGHVTINKMSADSFVDPPNSGLKATGTFTAGDGKISLNFNSLPSMIADGYSGVGTLDATVFDSASKP